VIGIGIDAVEIERLEQVLARRPGLAERLFTAAEGWVGAAGRAARFAAKEAAMKALGVGLGAFGFHDVSIVKEESGAPRLVVTGAAAALAAQMGVRSWKVSLTHTSSLAQAVVVAEGSPSSLPRRCGPSMRPRPSRSRC
jgi:holo-[acyl-carrier protein] synthase